MAPSGPSLTIFAAMRHRIPWRRRILVGRQNIRPLRHPEGESHAGADLARGMISDARAAKREINRDVVLQLPHRADEGGAGSKHANIVLIKDFSDWSHGPVIRTLDDRVEKVVGILLAGELNVNIEVACSPVPTLGVKNCSGPMFIIDPRQ